MIHPGMKRKPPAPQRFRMISGGQSVIVTDDELADAEREAAMPLPSLVQYPVRKSAAGFDGIDDDFGPRKGRGAKWDCGVL